MCLGTDTCKGFGICMLFWYVLVILRIIIFKRKHIPILKHVAFYQESSSRLHTFTIMTHADKLKLVINSVDIMLPHTTLNRPLLNG